MEISGRVLTAGLAVFALSGCLGNNSDNPIRNAGNGVASNCTQSQLARGDCSLDSGFGGNTNDSACTDTKLASVSVKTSLNGEPAWKPIPGIEISRGPYGGSTGTVKALLVSPDGDQIVAGGDFDGGVNATSEEGRFQYLVEALTDEVRALVHYQGQTVAAGYFRASESTDLNFVAQTMGESWQTVAQGIAGFATALKVFDGQLYIAGEFPKPGGGKRVEVRVLNGNEWQRLGDGYFVGQVFALEQYQGNIYAGGVFGRVGETDASNLAMWNGTSWQPVGGGTNLHVQSLKAWDDGRLYVGGDFTALNNGQVDSPHLAAWNGQEWQSVGADGTVRAIQDWGDALVMGGSFDTIGGVSAPFISQFDGTTFSAFPEELNNAVYALAESDGRLIVGGAFTFNLIRGVAEWGQVFEPDDGASDPVDPMDSDSDGDDGDSDDGATNQGDDQQNGAAGGDSSATGDTGTCSGDSGQGNGAGDDSAGGGGDPQPGQTQVIGNFVFEQGQFGNLLIHAEQGSSLGQQMIASHGDLNGDGFSELAFGGHSNADYVRIIFGQADFFTSSRQDLRHLNLGISDNSTNIRQWRFLASNGDASGDNLADLLFPARLIAGEPTEPNAYILKGAAGLESRGQIDVGPIQAEDGFAVGQFGFRKPDSRGDFNGDGLLDVLEQQAQTDSEGRRLPTRILLSRQVEGRVDYEEVEIRYGQNFRGAWNLGGDVNGDGFGELFAFDQNYRWPSEPGSGSDVETGAIHVLFGGQGQRDGQSISYDSLDGSNGFIIRGHHRFAISSQDNNVNARTDFDGDGFRDMGFALEGNSRDCLYFNRFYVVYGGGQVGRDGFINLADLDGQTGFAVLASPDENGALRSVFPPWYSGDFNGDGFDDLFSASADPDGFSNEEFVVLFGGPRFDKAAVSIEELDGRNGVYIEAEPQLSIGVPSLENFDAGDLDGDGRTDLTLLTSGFRDSAGRRYEGSIALFPGRAVDVSREGFVSSFALDYGAPIQGCSGNGGGGDPGNGGNGGGNGGNGSDNDDRDGDGHDNDEDNCPDISNRDQLDSDEDGQGDVCDADDDGDGSDDVADNCPALANPDQADRDGDGLGDACDTSPAGHCGTEQGLAPMVMPDATAIGTTGPLCLLCSVDNPANVVDFDPDNFATIETQVDVTDAGQLTVTDSVSTYPAGVRAGFIVANPTDLLSVELLGGLTIISYLDGQEQESVDLSGVLALDALELLGDGSRYFAGFEASLPFNGLAARFGGTAQLLSSLNIYGACVSAD